MTCFQCSGSDLVCIPTPHHKSQWNFYLIPFWIILSGGSQLPCHEDTPAALWKGSCGKEQMPSANILPAIGKSHLGAGPFAPVKWGCRWLQPSWTAASWQSLSQNHSVKSPLKSWSTKIVWDNKCLLVLICEVRIIFYTPMVNWNNNYWSWVHCIILFLYMFDVFHDKNEALTSYIASSYKQFLAGLRTICQKEKKKQKCLVNDNLSYLKVGKKFLNKTQKT